MHSARVLYSSEAVFGEKEKRVISISKGSSLEKLIGNGELLLGTTMATALPLFKLEYNRF
jgi:hypothetical protein